jgi:hypothetical protein
MSAHSNRSGPTVDAPADDGSTGETSSASRLVELRTSARGWHGVQLAVLGFIGLCGVLQGNAAQDEPRWLQVLAGVLVLVALALACTATALVATAAWPVHEIEDGPPAGVAVDSLLHHTASRLRLGIVITFLSVVVLTLGATSSWWPNDASRETSQVEVTTSQGTACGQLRDADPGTIAVQTARGPIAIPAGDVVRLRPVASCN